MRHITIAIFLLVSFTSIFAYDSDISRVEENLLKDALKNATKDKDAYLAFDQIVTKKGYPLINYFLTTSDGYILKLFRIPGPKGTKINEYTNKNSTRPVVLLQHGLLDSSDSWIANYEEKSLAFILANKNYDVWLGNNRGNKYSRNHMTLDPKEREFWNFSFHEMGTIDLPTIIEFILDTTGRSKISYIGHSQGSCQMFAAASLNPEYFSSRINYFIALGPVTSLGNIGSTFLSIVAKGRIDYVLETLGMYELFPDSESLDKWEVKLCSFIPILCRNLLQILADVHYKDDDMDRFLVFLSHYPAGTSLKTLRALANSVRDGNFVNYDTKVPYPLQNITNLPISLMVGKDDRLATVADSKLLYDILSQHNPDVGMHEYEDTGHASFFISEKVPFLKDIIQELDKIYEKNLLFLEE